MKYIRYTIYALLLLGLFSCNQGRIEELEDQVSELESENEALKSQIEEMEGIISGLRESSNEQRVVLSSQDALQQQRKWHQEVAEQHLRNAEFWRKNGNDFQYESSIRNAQNELNMMH